MIDAEFVQTLQERYSKGDRNGMWALLKPEGQMARLIALASRGVSLKAPRKPRDASKEERKTRIPENFPTAEEKTKAIAYWEKHRRPDLVARVDEIAEKFHQYFFARGERRLSWSVSWQTWYSNQIEYSPQRSNGPVAQIAFQQADLAGWIERLKVFHGMRDQPRGTWDALWGPRPGESGCRVPDTATAQFRQKWGRGAA